MRIINLIENTEGVPGCAYAHGLSFYIETGTHRLLLDLGPSGETISNAEKLGIDLTTADTVILSHGHYDHSGGILPFAKLNPHAEIYMQQTAGGEYYADNGEKAGGDRYRYIGIDKKICELPQVRQIRGDYRIDDELELLTVKKQTHALPFTDKRLLIRQGDRYVRDYFEHEHFLVISERGRRILMSGCAHSGIPNILDAYRDRYGGAPHAVISGFHFMKKTEYKKEELWEIIDTARILTQYPTIFFTCHCTGVPAASVMKDIMGEQLRYVHSGEEVDISSEYVFVRQ